MKPIENPQSKSSRFKLPMKDHEDGMSQDKFYIDLLERYIKQIDDNVESKALSKLQKAKLGIERYEYTVKLNELVKLYNEKIKFYAEALMPRFNASISAMNDSWDVLIHKISFAAESPVGENGCTEETKKGYANYLSLTAEEKSNPEIKLMFFDAFNKLLNK